MGRGGARKGAGRPKCAPTMAIRLPVSLLQTISKIQKLPLYASKVPAGFPSPAEDYIADNLDLNDYLIKNPPSTFLVRATGTSMIDAGIHDNDILVVDRSIPPSHGKIVIAAIDGQLTVKRLHKENNKFILMSENPTALPIEIAECSEVVIWGVVTNVIHAV